MNNLNPYKEYASELLSYYFPLFPKEDFQKWSLLKENDTYSYSLQTKTDSGGKATCLIMTVSVYFIKNFLAPVLTLSVEQKEGSRIKCVLWEIADFEMLKTPKQKNKVSKYSVEYIIPKAREEILNLFPDSPFQGPEPIKFKRRLLDEHGDILL